MFAHIAVTALVSGVLSLSFSLSSEAAIGLRCSDWLNARAYVRYDERTNKFVEVKPKNARPVSKEVDEQSVFVNAYVAGIVESYTWLDPILKQMADIPGLKSNPKITMPAFLDRVAELCRGSLQKDLQDADVLDIVSLHNQAMMMLRGMLVQELLQKFMDAGNQGATRR
jgi:hypothetical protein